MGEETSKGQEEEAGLKYMKKCDLNVKYFLRDGN